MAAEKGHLEIVKLLIGNGANIEETSIQGLNPLLMAAFCGKFEIVTLLIENGANSEAKNK